jgi:hypothetical protein
MHIEFWHIPKYVKFTEIAIIHVLGSVEDECLAFSKSVA